MTIFCRVSINLKFLLITPPPIGFAPPRQIRIRGRAIEFAPQLGGISVRAIGPHLLRRLVKIQGGNRIRTADWPKSEGVIGFAPWMRITAGQ